MGIPVEALAVEECHDTLILHPPVLHNGIKDDLAVEVHVLQLVPSNISEKLRDGEDGTCGEPTAHVVATDVVEHGIARYIEDVVLQLLQIVDAHHFRLRLRVAEDEVAKTHVLFEDMAQIDADLLGVLINKPEALSLRLLTVMALRALHCERQILILLPDSAEQFQSSLRIFVVGIESALQMWRRQREAHVGNHAETVVLIPIINGPRLLIVARQHHLGSSAHSQRGSMGVECLCGEVLTLHQNIIVEVG